MGKGIDNKHLVKRSEKLSFLECIDSKGASKFVRMNGFTNLTSSQNAKEYSRQYVDEDSERTDVVSYSESVAYAFDQYKDHPATEEIVKITENEVVGTAAVRRILTLDMTTLSGDGNANSYAVTGRIRPYAVVPSSNGDSTDCMTFSGDFKARGEKKEVTATLDKDMEVATIAYSEE